MAPRLYDARPPCRATATALAGSAATAVAMTDQHSGRRATLVGVIDPARLRADPEAIRDAQRRRGEPADLVDRLLAADGRRRAAIAEFERLRSEQKGLGRQVAAAHGDDRQALIEQGKALAAALKDAESEQSAATEAARELALQLPNPADPQAPVGGEDDAVVLSVLGQPRDFAAEGFEPRDHVELGRILGAIDIERGAKVSGSRFYYLTGVGALLELALVRLAMDQALAAGFVPVIPPSLVRPRAMEGTGFLGQAAADVFHLELDDLYLVGTSEVPLAAYHSDEILDADRLPLRYVGYSPCYRREAGSHGKDTRGIFRVHWFDKVEMFSFCALADAQDEHRRFLAWEREFLDLLELPYRVVDIAAGDLGMAATRKFDCEAWIPSQRRYRELTSTSNCTDFQSRRLGIRTRRGGQVEPVATLNGTLCSVVRPIVALLENHQRSDGAVVVPAALRPHLGGREVLEPVVTPSA